ncbi:MAG: TrmH family RNA methyltransferase [Alphaproteobacteria bacterium]
MAHKKTHRKPDRAKRKAPSLVHIYGLHAARAALENPAREVVKIWATANAANKLGHSNQPGAQPLEITTARALDALAPAGAVHQGVVVQAMPLPRRGADDPLLEAPHSGTGPLIALDQVTDPRNVGAILRAAAAFGASALLVTRHHRPTETGVLAKAASGGLEHVPIIEIGNLARTLGDLTARGFQVLGLDSDGTNLLEEITVTAQPVLVMGSEGAGLRRLTRERCETICRLNATGEIRSLNVSAAAAVALHTLVQRRTQI